MVAGLVLAARIASAQDGAPPPAVVVAPAAMTQLAQTVTLNGRLEADSRVILKARVSGFLEEVAFAPGARVEEGDVLFRIEPGPYAAAVQEAEGALAAARAARALAQVERDRQAELLDREAAPQAALDRAEAALAEAEADVTRLEGTLERARLELSYTEITAPFAGRIGTAEVDAGALIGPETGALATLIKLDPIHAEASVATATLRTFLEAVEAGQASTEGAARLILANGSEYSREGTIDFVDSEVAQGTDTVRIRARFDNPEGRLLDAELVRVVLRQATPAEVLAIPQTGVQRDLQGAFAMVVDDAGTVERRRIEVARVSQGLAVIAAGLEAGERVVTEGVNKVRPGITVDAAEAGG
jgi:membrane fusion protein (multidrug efflux system)